MKNQKGITLIALIITIIVMLILVGVSVTVALNGGLFKTAQEAAKKTETAKQEELTTGIALTEYYLAKANNETTAGSMQDYVLEKNGLKIGDKVDYNELSNGQKTILLDDSIGEIEEISTENLEWIVWGVNNLGQVELISKNPTQKEIGLYGDAAKIDEAGLWGMKLDIYAINRLNTFCDNLYAKGEYAESGRSLNAEELNKLVNFDPKIYPYYNVEYTFKIYNDYVYGILTEEISDFDGVEGWGTYNMTSFCTLEDEWYDNSDEGFEYNVPPTTDYYYNLSKKLGEAGYENLSNIFNSSTSWLSSSCIYSDGYEFGKGMFIINKEILRSEKLYDCYDTQYNYTYHSVRPVVTLKSDVTFTDVNKDGIFEIN